MPTILLMWVFVWIHAMRFRQEMHYQMNRIYRYKNVRQPLRAQMLRIEYLFIDFFLPIVFSFVWFSVPILYYWIYFLFSDDPFYLPLRYQRFYSRIDQSIVWMREKHSMSMLDPFPQDQSKTGKTVWWNTTPLYVFVWVFCSESLFQDAKMPYVHSMKHEMWIPILLLHCIVDYLDLFCELSPQPNTTKQRVWNACEGIYLIAIQLNICSPGINSNWYTR